VIGILILAPVIVVEREEQACHSGKADDGLMRSHVSVTDTRNTAHTYVDAHTYQQELDVLVPGCLELLQQDVHDRHVHERACSPKAKAEER
jgi:hypothetical protein